MHESPVEPSAHRIITWPFLGPGVYAVTLPIPFGRPVIFVRSRQSWEARPDHRAHEFVHLEQIDKLGRCGYLAAHVVARARSVFMWLRVDRHHAGGWKGFAGAFLAESQPIEKEAYDMERRTRDLITVERWAAAQHGGRKENEQ